MLRAGGRACVLGCLFSFLLAFALERIPFAWCCLLCLVYLLARCSLLLASVLAFLRAFACERSCLLAYRYAFARLLASGLARLVPSYFCCGRHAGHTGTKS